MSLEHSPRKVVRLARLTDFWGVKKSQTREVIEELVRLGIIDPPFNPCAGVGRSKCLWADQVARVQKIGLQKALEQAHAEAGDEDEGPQPNEAAPCKF
jgi:hypothetical protein